MRSPIAVVAGLYKKGRLPIYFINICIEVICSCPETRFEYSCNVVKFTTRKPPHLLYTCHTNLSILEMK